MAHVGKSLKKWYVLLFGIVIEIEKCHDALFAVVKLVLVQWNFFDVN